MTELRTIEATAEAKGQRLDQFLVAHRAPVLFLERLADGEQREAAAP